MTEPATRFGLYLVPNLLGLCDPREVLPERTLSVARTLQHFIVETPKAARAFLKTLDVPHAIASLSIKPMPTSGVPSKEWLELLAPLRAGHSVGLLSDAGCPGVADPGAQVVALAHAEGHRVVPLVGPSSILLGLMASGLNGQAFKFHGYLPVEAAARTNALKLIDHDIAQTDTTHLFIETPYRHAPLLAAIKHSIRPAHSLCIAQGLSTEVESVLTLSVSGWNAARWQPFLGKVPSLFLLGRSS